jgi:hypothetical protein
MVNRDAMASLHSIEKRHACLPWRISDPRGTGNVLQPCSRFKNQGRSPKNRSS